MQAGRFDAESLPVVCWRWPAKWPGQAEARRSFGALGADAGPAGLRHAPEVSGERLSAPNFRTKKCCRVLKIFRGRNAGHPNLAALPSRRAPGATRIFSLASRRRGPRAAWPAWRRSAHPNRRDARERPADACPWGRGLERVSARPSASQGVREFRRFLYAMSHGVGGSLPVRQDRAAGRISAGAIGGSPPFLLFPRRFPLSAVRGVTFGFSPGPFRRLLGNASALVGADRIE